MKPPIDNFKLTSYPDGQTTQFFGENPVLYGRFGLKGHNGIDLVAPHGSPLYAVEDATVVAVKNDPAGFGKHIRIISHGTGTCREWTYGHCATIDVAVNDKVVAGQKIGTMGNTGFVVSGATPFWKFNPYAGTHLHLGLRLVKRSVDGWSYPWSTVKIEVLDTGNGFKGSIDPVPTLATIGVLADEKKRRAQMLTIISLLNTMVSLLQAKRNQHL
jgi:murein DD-endopeptidase MepM/ murein hydrolase activator NlpD